MALLAKLMLLMATLLVLVAPTLSSTTHKDTDIAQRSQAGDPKRGNLHCGIYNTADKRNVVQLLYDLRKDKDKLNPSRNLKCTTLAKMCTRHACWNTSGVYICNDNDHDVTMDCATVADFAAGVADGCCTAIKSGLSGQQWSDQNWNAVVSYANCNADKNKVRPAMGPPNDPWGPNGDCHN